MILLTGLPINFNPAIGPLYFWEVGDQTSISNKALKFSFLWATAENTREHDDNYNFNEEHIIVNDFTAPFSSGEYCYMTSSNFNLLNANVYQTGTFNNGENFYQDDGSGTISYGTIWFANTSKILLNVTYGAINNNIPLYGVTSGANAWLAEISNTVICSNTSNNITVPFTGYFYPNQSIYLTKNDTSQT